MIDAASIITARLEASVALTAIVDERIFLYRVPPQSPLPAVTFEPVSDLPENDKDGFTGKRTQRWEVFCFADSKADATAMAEAVQAAMVAAGADADILLEAGWPDYNRETKVHQYRQEFSIWF